MNRTKIISTWQVFSLLFISRMILFITDSPQMSGRENSLFSLVTMILYFFISLLFLFPLYLLFRDHRELNLLQLSDYAFGEAGKAVPILLGGYLAFEACIELARYNMFVRSELMTEESVVLLSVTLMLCAVVGVFMGIQGLARTAGIFLLLIVLAMVFIFLALLPEFKLTNLEPFEFEGAGTMTKEVLMTLSRNSEFIALALLIPMMKGKLKKSAVWWTAGQGSAYLLIMIPILFALGSFGKTQQYPYFAAAKLAEWGVFQRLDALYSAIWIAAMFLKISTLLFLFTLSISHLFTEKIGKISLAAVAVPVTGIGVFITQHEPVFIWLYSGKFLIPMHLFFSAFLPLLVWVFTKRREKREGAVA